MKHPVRPQSSVDIKTFYLFVNGVEGYYKINKMHT